MLLSKRGMVITLHMVSDTVSVLTFTRFLTLVILDETIEAGMVLTDEPGVYLADKYGVRIEDDIIITENGCELITLAPKELIVL